MIHVSRWQYESIVELVKEAVNYAGSPGHDVEGEGHCLEIGGRTIEVAWSGYDNMTYADGQDHILYMVDEKVYDQWLAIRGHRCRLG